MLLHHPFRGTRHTRDSKRKIHVPSISDILPTVTTSHRLVIRFPSSTLSSNSHSLHARRTAHTPPDRIRGPQNRSRNERHSTRNRLRRCTLFFEIRQLTQTAIPNQSASYSTGPGPQHCASTTSIFLQPFRFHVPNVPSGSVASHATNARLHHTASA